VGCHLLIQLVREESRWVGIQWPSCERIFSPRRGVPGNGALTRQIAPKHLGSLMIRICGHSGSDENHKHDVSSDVRKSPYAGLHLGCHGPHVLTFECFSRDGSGERERAHGVSGGTRARRF
jgi:hypothetical protein